MGMQEGFSCLQILHALAIGSFLALLQALLQVVTASGQQEWRGRVWPGHAALEAYVGIEEKGGGVCSLMCDVLMCFIPHG